MNTAVCFVIGEGLLAAETIGALCRAGLRVAGVLGDEPSVTGACEAHGVVRHTQRAPFLAAMKDRGCDLLFSVNNSWIVPAQVLAMARVAAINFHDAPLPRYGGLFATSWALINGETQHGISWHRMEPGIDTGELLVQRAVAIEPDDTAHSLNARCFAEAKQALDELLAMLKAGNVRGFAQPAEPRLYHGLADRPWAAGLLDFERDARSLERLVRALDFGTVFNPLAAAKCLLGGELFIVARAELRADGARGVAGCCVAASEDELCVQTAEGVLALRELRDLHGQRVGIGACLRRLGIAVGQPLVGVAPAELTRLDGRFRALARHEPFWLRQLGAQREQRRILPAALRRPSRRAWPLAGLAQALTRAGAAEAGTTGALIAAFVARVASLGSVELGLGVPHLSPLEAACFANIVPLRVDAGPTSTSGFIAAYREARAELARRCSYARDLFARSPALRQQPAPRYELAIFDDVDCVPDSDATIDAAFVLRNGRTPLLLSYTLLDDGQLAAIDHALATFAEAALHTPDAPLARLPLLSAEAQQVIVHDWNATPGAGLPRASGETLTSLFSAQARRTPEACAVRHGEQSTSYQELDLLSSALAATLRARGVVPGARVLVSLPHGLALVAALLGVMKAGAAYVPVDPDAPPGRRDAILTAAAPVITLCEPSARGLWEAHTPCLTLAPCVSSSAPAAMDSVPAPNGTACVIFTSGSTGVPKGVEVLQGGLVNHALAMRDLYQLTPSDRVLCASSIGFDLCGEQIYPALLAGAEVVMRPPDLFDSLSRFEGFLRGARITTLILAAGFWHEWMHSLAGAAGALPPALRVVAVGAERVLARHVATFERLAGDRVRLFQGYGPTEATITCTMYQHLPGTLREGEDLPIGRPLPNVQTYVLDQNLMPLPVGFAGDLYVAGDGLARGYLESPQLTEERFVDSPFIPGARMYKTGDRARYREDGQLMFLGREDNQVKLRGFRVELAEVEAALGACAGVAECAVLLVQAADGPARLVAYVARPESHPELTADALRRQLEQRVPAYMVPHEWLFLAGLPRTLNHKLDRGALAQLPAQRDECAERACRTPLEQSLCRLIAELLPSRPVGRDDDFFRDLGGDSLLAIRLIGRIAIEHHVELSLSELVRDASVRALAARISSPTADRAHDYITFQPGAQDGRPPLWLLPAVGGHVVYADCLRRTMDQQQAIYGIEAPGLRESTQPLDRIEDMAEAYLRVIRDVQPRGPYVIAGPSLGGLAAWQIASQLAQQGETQVTVVLLDTWAPGYPRELGALERLVDQAGQVVRQPSLAALWSLVVDRLDFRIRKWSGVPRYTLADELEGDRGERIRAVVRCAQVASLAYRPPRLASQVVLFRATENGHSSGVRFDALDNGWGPRLAPDQLRIVPVPTHHEELSDRPPGIVGQVLQQLLDDLRVPAPRGVLGNRVPSARAAAARRRRGGSRPRQRADHGAAWRARV